MAVTQASQSQRRASSLERSSPRNALSARFNIGVAAPEALGDQQRLAIQEEIGRARRAAATRRPPVSPRAPPPPPPTRVGLRETARVHRRGQRLSVGFARERGIKRLEALGGARAAAVQRRCRGSTRTRSDRAATPPGRAGARSAVRTSAMAISRSAASNAPAWCLAWAAASARLALARAARA